ncbi:MAG: DNA polymerase III, subunit gamma and tau [Clostridiales bacterium 43-6]|nr:MAG: DNA polymerase III, subunit gamma and tau [Clostridiales bacterium 43-6]
MYQALYRKYRPQTFSDLSGQNHVTVTLKNQMVDGRISHAYLFTGSRGTGKTSCAKILSKAVNCLSPVEGDPCNSCENCVGIDNGSILDVVEIDAASNNGVDNIRDLRERVEYTPANGKYRVYIIDEVHMLSTGAFNALLKTLEEPPAHVIFILATTEVHKLPATILSRCQRFDFNRITSEATKERLQYVCEKEQLTITDDGALLIARLSDGAMRDALSLLDLCAGIDTNITEAIVSSAAGLAGRDYLYDIAKNIKEGNAGGLLTIADKLYGASFDMERLCDELISLFRNLMILKTVKEPQAIIVCTAMELDKLKETAREFNLTVILHSLLLLEGCKDGMKKGASPRIMLETALIKLCMPELDNSTEALLRRITELEHALKTGGPVAVNIQSTVPPSQEIPGPETETAPPPPAVIRQETGEKEITPFRQWPEVMSELSKRAKVIYSVLHGSDAYVKGNLLLIDSKNSQFRDLIKGDSNHREAIRKALLVVTGKEYRLGPYIPTETTPKPAEEDPMGELADKLKSIGATVL